MVQAISVDFRKASRGTHSAQLGFILTELSAGMTFASIALAKKGEAQARYCSHARAAYNSALHFLDQITITGEQLKEIHARIAFLKRRLRTLGEKF